MLSWTEIREGVVFSVRALTVNPLRTSLSLIGVTIGIFAMISVFTFVDSIELSIKDLVSGLGEDLVFVQKWPIAPEDGDKEYAWWKYFQRREPSLSDMTELSERLSTAEAISMDGSMFRPLTQGNNSMDNGLVIFTTHTFPEVYPLNIVEGRFFTANEFRTSENVVILGGLTAENLFPNMDPMYRTIQIDGRRVEVIGVLETEGESVIGNNFDEAVIIPATYASTMADITVTNNKIWIKAKEGVSNEELKGEVTGRLRAIHRLKPKEDKDFSLVEMTMITGFIDGIFDFFRLVALIIGSFSILVGGFGIANIMFVSVKERTRIIGIQKALGAKRGFILIQFLIESVAISLIGGLFALILIFGLTFLADTFVDFEVKLTEENALIGLCISISIGILAGIIPAWQASRMDPVVAMRAG